MLAVGGCGHDHGRAGGGGTKPVRKSAAADACMAYGEYTRHHAATTGGALRTRAIAMREARFAAAKSAGGRRLLVDIRTALRAKDASTRVQRRHGVAAAQTFTAKYLAADRRVQADCAAVDAAMAVPTQ